MAPGGKITRSPIATDCAVEGIFGFLPKIPPMALLTVAAAFCAALVTVAELLDTVTVCPSMIRDESCATQFVPFLASVTAAMAPCGMVTLLPALTALETVARYCLPAGSRLESTVSIIRTSTVVPGVGATCVAVAGAGVLAAED